MKTALKIVLAWTPLLLLWALFLRINADVGIVQALRAGFFGIGTAAVLGQGVWWVTGRFAWPDQVRPSFYALHALLGGAFALAWLLLGDAALSYLVDGGLAPGFFRVWAWPNGPWRFLMGLWLYGLVAGVCYALRIRHRLREQERAAARLEALATDARLSSLRARLNPHFLFNALNTVAALIPEEPQRAEAAVERLAGLLRYSLADSDHAVPLADEWAFTRDYLDLEGLRLGDRLTVEADLSDAALAVTVPPFSVQTLVENAVRHGAAPRAEGAHVRVAAGVESGTLWLSVEDDGPGCAVDAPSTGGSGLPNLRERLVGMYGDRARLEVASAPGRGFRVRLEVPAAGPAAGHGSADGRSSEAVGAYG